MINLYTAYQKLCQEWNFTAVPAHLDRDDMKKDLHPETVVLSCRFYLKIVKYGKCL